MVINVVIGIFMMIVFKMVIKNIRKVLVINVDKCLCLFVFVLMIDCLIIV